MSDRLPENRLFGGLWCTDVLGGLPDYLEGTLPSEIRARVDEHLAACDVCARFGGQYAAVIEGIRARLSVPASSGVAERLDAKLAEILGSDQD